MEREKRKREKVDGVNRGDGKKERTWVTKLQFEIFSIGKVYAPCISVDLQKQRDMCSKALRCAHTHTQLNTHTVFEHLSPLETFTVAF